MSPLFSAEIWNQEALHIDLSNGSDYTLTIDNLEGYIDLQLKKSGLSWALGGYLENREIYQGSEVFREGTAARNIHLGIDFWLPAGTSVFAPWTGSIVGFKDHSSFGNYGPTLILKHDENAPTKYSLFGHLSKADLDRWNVGKEFKAGDLIAHLGRKEENVGWPPHLHFQLITELLGKKDDFPGVCFDSEKNYYASICPNPLSYITEGLIYSS